MEIYYLEISTRSNKKWMVKRYYPTESKIIHFGSALHEDYTIHKDETRKERYLKRHEKNEDWGKSGIDTSGWWAVHLLWNKPTIKGSIKDVEKRFNIKIIY